MYYKKFTSAVMAALMISRIEVTPKLLENNDSPNNPFIWITMDKNNVTNLSKSRSIQNLPSVKTFDHIENENYNIFMINRSYLHNFSREIHSRRRYCGGFVVHQYKKDHKKHVEKVKLAGRMDVQEFRYTIDQGDIVNKIMRVISGIQIEETINGLTDFNNRYFESDDGLKASEWLKMQWDNYTLDRQDIVVEYYKHGPLSKQPSVIASIQGATNDIVIVGAHLDSIIGYTGSMENNDEKAPGADDNASGVAILTEVLSSIAKTGYKPSKTIKIMAFGAEEVGLIGSRDIAREYKSQGYNVVGMLNFDMVAYKGSKEDIFIYCDTHTNPGQNRFLKHIINTYMPELTVGHSQCPGTYAGCSDHFSWAIEGFPASYVSESDIKEDSGYMHTINDTKVNVFHATKFAKLAAIYLIELAKDSKMTSKPRQTVATSTIRRSSIIEIERNCAMLRNHFRILHFLIFFYIEGMYS